MLRVGFTGTQKGMTGQQRKALLAIFSYLPEKVVQFHHGDCIGADEEASHLVRSRKSAWKFKGSKADIPLIFLHPPTDSKKRAYCRADVIRPQKDYLTRNHEIVDETDILIACPSSREEELRSGTWATVRYARLREKEIYLIYPDGEVKVEVAGRGMTTDNG